MNFIFVLGAMVSAYFNAAMMCFLAKIAYEHGTIWNPVKAVAVLWPMLKAILLGFLPAGFLSAVFLYFFPGWEQVPIIIISFGVLVSALLLHSYLLALVEHRPGWNWAIAILAFTQIGGYLYLRTMPHLSEFIELGL
ncbi:MAG: hypothetical protein AAF423_06690 [Pseudomonadota bacterium]